MPLRPRFSVSQDDEYVLVRAVVPHVRVGDAEVDIDGARLSLWCAPYLLKLQLPGELVDDERARATYDPAAGGGTLTVFAPKAVRGQHFPDLDLTSRLIAPPPVWPAREGCTEEDSGGGVEGLPEALLRRLDCAGDALAAAEDAETGAECEAAEGSGWESVGLSQRAVLEPVGAHGAARAAATAAVASARAAHAAARRVGGPLIEVTSSIDFAEGVEGCRNGGGDIPEHPGSCSAGESSTVEQEDSALRPAACVLYDNGGGGNVAAPILSRGGALGSSSGGGEARDRDNCNGDGGDDEQWDDDSAFDTSHLPPQGAAASKLQRRPRDAAPAVLSPTLSATHTLPLAPTPAPHLPTLAPTCGYGFNRGKRGVFVGALKRELALGLLELPDPEATPAVLRPALREAAEDAAWDPERYAADYAAGEDDPVYADALRPPWWSGSSIAGVVGEIAGADGGAGPWTWTEAEADALAALPWKEWLLDGELVGGTAPGVAAAAAGGAARGTAATVAHPGLETSRVLAVLATVLYAYAYDHRTTGGEPSVESAWTIATLAPPLAWLDDEFVASQGANSCGDSATGADPVRAEASAEASGLLSLELLTRALALPPPAALDGAQSAPTLSPFSAPRPLMRLIPGAIDACVRRALVFPYLRRWDIALLCAADAATLLLGGVRPVLRAVLAARRVFAGSGDTADGIGGEGARYLFNALLLDDLAAWLARGGARDAHLAAAGAAVSATVSSLAGPGGKERPAFAAWMLLEVEQAVDNGDNASGGGETDTESSTDSTDSVTDSESSA